MQALPPKYNQGCVSCRNAWAVRKATVLKNTVSHVGHVEMYHVLIPYPYNKRKPCEPKQRQKTTNPNNNQTKEPNRKSPLDMRNETMATDFQGWNCDKQHNKATFQTTPSPAPFLLPVVTGGATTHTTHPRSKQSTHPMNHTHNCQCHAHKHATQTFPRKIAKKITNKNIHLNDSLHKNHKVSSLGFRNFLHQTCTRNSHVPSTANMYQLV